jgi:hypothetical protein
MLNKDIKIGDKVKAGINLPQQNIGYGIEYFDCEIVKVNRVTCLVKFENGSVKKVMKNLIK